MKKKIKLSSNRPQAAKDYGIIAVLMLGISVLCVSSLLSSHSESKQTTAVPLAKTFGGGELKVIEGIPFLKLSGSHYEMGEQYGVLLKEEFQKIYHELFPYKKTWSAQLSDDICNRLVSITGGEFIRQLKGMAAGSGLPYNDLLLGSYFGVFERGGCSSILLKIGKKGSQRLIHGRNYDYGSGTGKYPVVIEYNPSGGLRHLSIGTIAAVGTAEGMNEKGITVSGNLAPGDLRKTGIQNVCPDIKIREILSSASTLDDVDTLMEGYVGDVGYTFTVGSVDEDDGVIYDVKYGDMRKNRLNGRTALYATNGYVNEEWNPVKDDARYRIIDGHVKKRRVNSIDEMIEVLSDPGVSFGVNNPSTIHSVVFDARHQTVYMAFNTRFAAWSDWFRYDWGKDTLTVSKEAEKERLRQSEGAELTEVHVTAAYWNGDLPGRGSGPKTDDPHFWILIREWLKEKDVDQLYEFSARAAGELTLETEGKPDIRAVLTKGTVAMENLKGFMFKIVEEDLPEMVPGLPYKIHFDNVSAVYKWIVEEGVKLIRPGKLETN
jgi:hypothetical protein